MEDGSINKNALFSDGTENYVIPPECDEGDTVRIRFRTLRDDVDGVLFITVSERSLYSIILKFSKMKKNVFIPGSEQAEP